MKTKPPYKQKAVARSASEQLLKDAHDRMNDVIQEWEVPDSPEGFCYAIKGLMVHRDRIADHLGIPKANSLLSKQGCLDIADISDTKPQ